MRMKRPLLLATSIFILAIFVLFGFGACKGITLKLPSFPNSGKSSQSNSVGALQRQVAGVGLVTLELTYPAGQSPKVFTKGWVFGARCLINPGKSDQKDISNLVQWSGSGSFDPATGPLSHPSFAGEGSNNIILTISAGSNNISTQYTVSAVSPANYAHVGIVASCPADGHGAPGEPKLVMGPITTGSLNVMVNGKSAARVGDVGTHCCCSGPNTFEIVSGDSDVLIDGKPAARIGDRTKHCGGYGVIDLKATIHQETIGISTPSEYFMAGDSVPINITVEYPQKARSAVIKFGDDGSELKMEPQSTSITHVFKQGSWRVEAQLLDEQGAELFSAETPLIFVLGSSDCELKIEPETVNGEPGKYTFIERHAFTSHPTLVWDIDGSPKQNGSQESFSADFKLPGQGTVSVTEMINGKPFCKATAYITIKPPASQSSTTTVPPLQVNNPGNTTTTTQNTGTGWYLDGNAAVTKSPPNPDDCSYFGKMLTIVPGEAIGVQSWKDCSNQSKCSGSYTGNVKWTPPPSFMQPGSKVILSMSEKTTANNTCGYRNLLSSGGLNIDGALIMEVMEYTNTPSATTTYTVKSGSIGNKMSIVFKVTAASLYGTITYNYTYK